MRRCIHCHTTERELRPYGPEGQDVCFKCAFSTAEREHQTERGLLRQLMVPGPLVLDDREEAGPRPMSKQELASYAPQK